MGHGLRYRGLSIGGTLVVTAFAVYAANHAAVQHASMVVPIYNNLEPTTLAGAELYQDALLATAAVVAAMAPLYRPRPRRRLDTIELVVGRVFLAMVALAAIGYFDYTYRVPRTTLVLATAILSFALPLWFAMIRRQPTGRADRAIIVGDDPNLMERVCAGADLPFLGYVSPPGGDPATVEPSVAVPDGGVPATASLECLGGLSRLEDVIVRHDVDTVVLAFANPDREEFFGALDTCYELGVTAKVHRDHTDYVLTTDIETGELIDIDLEPWGWADHVTKRAFDVVFSAVGLVVLAPVMGLIGLAIVADDGGPVLYSQRRTAAFGESYTVYKFRSMVTDAEGDRAVLSEEDNGGSDPRVTRVGRFLRRTHLDEIPQLWSVLKGDMSVVGPRPERPELDTDMETSARSWRRRWFVTPGLTGLAQVNDVTAFDPDEKLRFDVAYIRNQSFFFDLKIVVRQLVLVGVDIFDHVVGGDGDDGPRDGQELD